MYRHRFTAAHELGHLVLHGECSGDSPLLEREADRFRPSSLPPGLIRDLLPRRVDFRRSSQLSEQWEVSIKSLIYRCREVGLLSDATTRRGYIRLNHLTEQGIIAAPPVYQFVGKIPALLRRAVELAEQNGVTTASLVREHVGSQRRYGACWATLTYGRHCGRSEQSRFDGRRCFGQ
ncbi:ImmA/IrrE family metallo-endopeptidase [Mycolicibacterium arseniciresistens]|uniref:ImmA/IrrE family metallo-endopeptidase n=1 Tax=Mycolicibacterium arseniciresistens TaxID=3062257 RepID=UPI00389969AC